MSQISQAEKNTEIRNIVLGLIVIISLLAATG